MVDGLDEIPGQRIVDRGKRYRPGLIIIQMATARNCSKTAQTGSKAAIRPEKEIVHIN